MEEKDGEIEIRLKGEPMNEMLSEPPKWIVRSGSILFFFVLLLLLGLTWFIRYPDEVTGEFIMTGSQLPVELTNRHYTQLKVLHVKENQQVEKGDVIAQFDIQEKYGDLVKKRAYLNSLKIFKGNFQREIPLPEQTGSLEMFDKQWTTLLNKIEEWNWEHSENIAQAELNFIQREISFREQLQVISNQEQTLSSQPLIEQAAVSKQTVGEDKRTQMQTLQVGQSQKEQEIRNLIALNNLRKEIWQKKQDARLRELQQSAEIQLSINRLEDTLRTCENDAFWIAPCSGKILFNKVLQVNHYYKANEASIVIVPKGSDYSALATISNSGAGKVQVGQKVFIELADFPKSEFGLLEGRVTGMTQIDKDGKYELKISLPKRLKTSYNKEIPFKVRLKGIVKIITKDKRLLERVFEQLTDLVK